MKRHAILFTILCLAAGLMVSGTITAQEKIKIEKLDDLPRHTYQLDIPAIELFDNDEAVMKLAGELKADLLADLEKYDIQDKTTLSDYYSALGTIAELEGDDDTFLKYIELDRNLQDKDAIKLTMGLSGAARVKTRQSDAEDKVAAFTEAYKALITPLPYDVVEARLKSAKASYEMGSETLIGGIVESRIQPILDQSGGEMSKDIATSLVRFNATVRHVYPYKSAMIAVLDEYLAAHNVEKADIWAEREVTLPADADAKPVVVCIWDSGIDTKTYKGQLWTNANEVPGNGIDDDNNGYVDDVHGIAYTLHSDKTPELLFPIGDISSERPRLQRMMKALSDLQANIDSEESTELKMQMSKMQRDEVQPFIESIGKYGNYAHGTHVAGIAARGNPFIQLMASRLTFGYKMIPETPTIEQAVKDSIATIETIDYYRKNGVRVVNMSWGGDLAGVESALEANNVGGTPEERKELARKIFEIGKQSLYHAMKNAPEILFVTSAGNDDNDVTFEETIPSSFDFPNIMSVGAVDQAGDETSFTSFGKVDVYANGFEVESYVPGGDPMKMSGTSQASPNVTNLAAKILALRPELNPVQVRELIEKGCDEKKVGERSVNLINPKKTMELLAAMK